MSRKIRFSKESQSSLNDFFVHRSPEQPKSKAEENLPTGILSAFRTDAANVIIDTLKPAEDGSGDLILRLYESKKADTYFHVLSGLAVKALQRCDLLENPVGELEEADAALHVRPFEVLTLRVKL